MRTLQIEKVRAAGHISSPARRAQPAVAYLFKLQIRVQTRRLFATTATGSANVVRVNAVRVTRLRVCGYNKKNWITILLTKIDFD